MARAPTPTAPVMYQAGAIALPVAAPIQATTNWVEPPNTATARAYTKPRPRERFDGGRSSASAAKAAVIATAAQLPTNAVHTTSIDKALVVTTMWKPGTAV